MANTSSATTDDAARSSEPSQSTEAPEQPAPPKPAEQPESRGGSAPQPASPESDGTLGDARRLVQHNLGWLARIKDAVETVFHYFFVGCVSLLGLAIVFLIPLGILACFAVLLGIPGYLVHQWLGARFGYTLPILVTIFWAGYFFTHGWPRLKEALQKVLARVKPWTQWGGRVLARFAEHDEDSPSNSKTAQQD